MNEELLGKTAVNMEDILTHSLKLGSDNKVLVIYDNDYELTRILTQGYKTALKNLQANAEFYDFEQISKDGKDKVVQMFEDYNPSDLVVLIQSGSFRLDDFRIRLHLFSKNLKVIEHLHLHRNDPSVFDVYIASLKYDDSERQWYQKMKDNLVSNLSSTDKLQLKYAEATLETSKLEIPKINIGDYTGMGNVGGTFPIGEVFTESQDFASMTGSVYIYGFADRNFNVCFYDPFRLDISQGLITGFAQNTPQEFIDVLNLVKEYERPMIREIGFGLNRAITKARPLGDITAYERILGVHFSLGEKHSVYKKAGITTHKTKFHIDLFLCIDQVSAEIGTKTVQIMDKSGYVV